MFYAHTPLVLKAMVKTPWKCNIPHFTSWEQLWLFPSPLASEDPQYVAAGWGEIVQEGCVSSIFVLHIIVMQVITMY